MNPCSNVGYCSDCNRFSVNLKTFYNFITKVETRRCYQCCLEAENRLKGDPNCDDSRRKYLEEARVVTTSELAEMLGKSQKYLSGLTTLDCMTESGQIIDYKTAKNNMFAEQYGALTCKECGWKIKPDNWYCEIKQPGGYLCGPHGIEKARELASATGYVSVQTNTKGDSYSTGLTDIYEANTRNPVLNWKYNAPEAEPLKSFYEMTDTEIEQNLRVSDGPKVTLVAESQYLDNRIDQFLSDRGITYDTDAEYDADALAEFAGRMCYWSFPEHLRRKSGDGQNRVYLDHIREVGHGSVTEHSFFTFVIDDLSKNTTQELVRHRVGVAYSIQSSRYVDQFSNEYFGNSGHSFGVYIPSSVKGCRDLLSEWFKQWVGAIRCYKRTYDNLRKQGHSKKDARSDARHILPGGMCNTVVFTVNCRELNHIFALRGNLHAEREIRLMALALYEEVKEMNVFSHWERVTTDKGDVLKIKERPLFKNIKEAVEYMSKEFPGIVVDYTPIKRVEGYDDMETPAYNKVKAFVEEAKPSQHWIHVAADKDAKPTFESSHLEDTNQLMEKKDAAS